MSTNRLPKTLPNSTTNQHHRSLLPSAIAWGTFYGLVASIGYTAANICLRSVTHCDPVWVSCVKAFPTVALVSPWMLIIAHRGKKVLPPAKVLAALVLSALLGHLCGNVAFQWSLGVIGIALSVPLLMGTMIVGGVVLGRIFLQESISLRMAVSTCLLIIAICILSLGAVDAHHSVTQESSTSESHSLFFLFAGVAAAAMSGLAYAILGVVIRHGVTGKSPLSSTIVIISFVGMITLGAISLVRIGPEEMVNTNGTDLGVMIMAGLCNAVAFLSLTKALQLTTVIYVNALNSTQVAMAAAIGVLMFGEAPSIAMSAGVALTMVGLLCMRRRRRV